MRKNFLQVWWDECARACTTNEAYSFLMNYAKEHQLSTVALGG